MVPGLEEITVRKSVRIRGKHRVFLLLGLVVSASLMMGFFHLPPVVQVIDIKSVAGTYQGSFTTNSGREVDVKIVINADGTYYSVSPRGKRPGKVSIADGKLILTRPEASPTKCTIRENKDKRIMTTTSARGEGQYTFVK